MLITFLSPSALLGHTYQLAMENFHFASLPEVAPRAPRISYLSPAFKKKKKVLEKCEMFLITVQFITQSKVCLDVANSFPLDLVKASLLIPH